LLSVERPRNLSRF